MKKDCVGIPDKHTLPTWDCHIKVILGASMHFDNPHHTKDLFQKKQFSLLINGGIEFLSTLEVVLMV
jgi:hypothetical protein